MSFNSNYYRGQETSGILEVHSDGYGFVYQDRRLPGSTAIYVSASQIRRFNLKTDDYLSGLVRPPNEDEKFFSFTKIEKVNGQIARGL
jgi:transcription termination factor Rho